MKHLFFILVMSLGLTGCLEGEGEPYQWENLEGIPISDTQKGALHFLYGDFGSLHGKAVARGGAFPWRITQAAIRFANDQMDDEAFKEKLSTFGLLFPQPEEIANTPEGVEVELLKNTPLGFVRGQVSLRAGGFFLGNLDTAVIGCATCHSSPGYDAHGNVQLNEIWLGDSSPSFNPEGFVNEIYLGYKDSLENKSAFKKYFHELFPEANKNGYFLSSLLGEIEKTISQLDKYDIHAIVPQHNGGPGLTNGVGYLKYYLKDFKDLSEFRLREQGYTSIPSTFDRGFRSSLLADGAYGYPGENHFRTVGQQEALSRAQPLGQIVAFFTVPTMGNSPERVPPYFKEVKETLTFLSSAPRERFPGKPDLDAAKKGQSLYKTSCQSCHGTYTDDLTYPQLVSFPNRLVPLDKIKTDPLRTLSIDESFKNTVYSSGFKGYVDVSVTHGYVAPLLSQIWKSAPYLHNGSVPTLASLFGIEPRPQKFMTGGHNLDFVKMGIRGQYDDKGVYRISETPWATPEIYDTTQPGRSNQGHESEFSHLSEQDKWHLIEYLKFL